MQDSLVGKPLKNETIIINLDHQENPGSHWVCVLKLGDDCLYFDPIGGLQPPKSIIRYLKGCKIYYNLNRFQKLGTSNCGQLCIRFLYGEYF